MITNAEKLSKDIKLDYYLSIVEKSRKFMGSIAVSHEGRLVYSKQLGFSDVYRRIKADHETKYRIGSISKTFTAVLVLDFIEKKTLNLKETLDSFFPQIANSSRITIEHLLSHRSGIHNFTTSKEYYSWDTTFKSKKTMLKIIADGGSNFTPGTKAEYSDSNYVLLSYILEKICGKPFRSILDEKLISPLGLNNTKYGDKIIPTLNEALSYKYSGAWRRSKETHMSIPSGAGGIVSTPIDILQFINALFENRIISRKSVNLMQHIEDNYGMGLSSFTFNGSIAYGHTGGIDEFTSLALYFPKEKLGLAICSNAAVYDVTENVLRSIFNIRYTVPNLLKKIASKRELNMFEGEFISKRRNTRLIIKREKEILIINFVGQATLAFEPISKTTFRSSIFIMSFSNDKRSLVLKSVSALCGENTNYHFYRL